MNIRKKSLALIALTVTALILALYTSARLILLRSYAELEAEYTRRNIKRARDALLNELAGLDSFVYDWAAWDDTYEFVKDRNEEYRRSNLIDQTFIDSNLNLISIFDPSGRLVYGKVLDRAGKAQTGLPPDFMEYFSSGSPLLKHADTKSSVKGIILTRDAPMLIASRPIITSENKGPLRGTLLMGRYLTDESIEHLSRITHLPLTLHPLHGHGTDGVERDAHSIPRSGSGITVHTPGSDHIVGCAILRDIYGEPALALELKLPRQVYRQGVASIAYYALSLVVGGVVICAAIVILLDRVVLSRLASMSGRVRKIGRGEDLSLRVPAEGHDELAGLGADINDMLDSLERTQRDLRERTERIGRQRAAILELSMHEISSRDAALREIARVASKTLGARRVSIWTFNEDRSEISCLVDYNGGDEIYEGGTAMAVKDYPSFFKAVEECRLIIANDARSDTRTRELAESYIIPRGITSLIDAPVRLHGKTIGIICFEHAGAPREWTHDEQHFAGSMADFVSIVFEASGRLIAEEARTLLAEAVEQAAESIVISDSDAKVFYVNPAFERTTGYSRVEITGKTLAILKSGKHDDAFFREMWNTLRRGEVWKGRIINSKKDGTLYEAEATISPILDSSGATTHFVEVRRDVTLEAALEDQLRHAQKMEAVGTLAGGMAHDFNNILAGIMGYTSLVRSNLERKSPLVDDLKSIERLSLRGADLTQALLTFSKRGEYNPKPLDITLIVQEVLKVIGRTAGKKIIIRTDFPQGIATVLGDEGQLNQVLMNLCINACEAMPLGGMLTVSARNVEPEKSFLALHPALTKDAYVSVVVSDTGKGMDEKTRLRIFEPFFTTKSERRGTGLGLSIVQGIVEKHGGCIETESETERGSTFTLYLPVTAEEIVADGAEPAGTLRGEETILVVDDEDDFRRGVRRWLRNLGYTVIEATSGEEALSVIGRDNAVDLVILDMEMKGIGGKEVFGRLREISPLMAVIICTGYTLNGTAKSLLDEGANDFIQKPFNFIDLALKIRSVLNA